MSLRFSPTWAGGRPAPPHDTSRGLLVCVVPSTTANFNISTWTLSLYCFNLNGVFVRLQATLFIKRLAHYLKPATQDRLR